jgi:hypothetical protein
MSVDGVFAEHRTSACPARISSTVQASSKAARISRCETRRGPFAFEGSILKCCLASSGLGDIDLAQSVAMSWVVWFGPFSQGRGGNRRVAYRPLS